MLMHEEFERCQKCGNGWFTIQTQVLIKKGSSTNNVIPMGEKKCYICINCQNEQYISIN